MKNSAAALVERLLLEEASKLTQFLQAFADRVVVVGSRGSETKQPRPDSDIDLHVVDIMDTDETWVAVQEWLKSHSVEFQVDDGLPGLWIGAQEGFEVPIEMGHWWGTPEETRPVSIFGAAMRAFQT